MNTTRTTPALALAAAVALAGCAATASRQEPPSTAMQAAYKEAPAGWMEAAPADLLERGAWWSLFNDAGLDALMPRVDVSNQNIAAAAAAYAQAQAAVREQRASLFPTVGVTAGATRSGGRGSSSSTSNDYEAALGASWEPDVWGRLSGAVSSAGARAQASAADLAAARLSAQGALATNYFSLRETDAEAELLRSTIAAYERAGQIAQNRYAAGVAPRSDVLQAQTQLANAQADLLTLLRQRAQLEHAIAVLVGEAPGSFSLAPAAWDFSVVPSVPLGLPSELLQRRPDVAAAERSAAAANAQIGVSRAAFFPSFSLTGRYGFGAASLSDLFSSSAAAWSLGLSITQAIFDAGGNKARLDQARAAWEQSVAQYRQAVLVAFQDVEDSIAAVRLYEQQEALRRAASQAADETEQQVLNRYRAGQVSYTEVVTAQVSALSARRALVQLSASRQTSTIALIQALGGGWKQE